MLTTGNIKADEKDTTKETNTATESKYANKAVADIYSCLLYTSLMMAAAVLTTVPVTNNVKAADKEITSGAVSYTHLDVYKRQ